MAQLLDAYGRPVDMARLKEEIARPALTGVRSIWNYSYMTGGLTPDRLASLLQRAAEGDSDDYLTLAEEMEEKDPHYASVLGTRKRAVARLPIVVEAASDDPFDVKLADEIRELFSRRGTKGMIEECLDALGKGYSVNEIIWNRAGTPWQPQRYEWRDQRFFTFDRETMRELRLKDDLNPTEGIPLPPYKFITHLPRLKCGIPIRGGLARLAAWTYIFKNYSVKDWVAFCEVFGMPLRVGKYRPGETEDNISILKAAVANLGSDAAAVIPDGMMIEFIETGKGTGGESLFERIANWFDKQLSKAILGQTMTADDGSSKSQAQVHDEVREDIRDADAEQLAETLERDLVRPYVDLNYGPQKNYPNVALREPDQTDIPVMAEALAKLVPLGGLRVEASQVLDKLGFADPAKGAVCLGDKPQEAPPVKPVIAANAISLNSLGTVLFPDQQLIDELGEQATPEEQRSQIEAVLAPVIKGLQETGNPDDAMTALVRAFPEMDDGALQKMLAQLIFISGLIGRISARD